MSDVYDAIAADFGVPADRLREWDKQFPEGFAIMHLADGTEQVVPVTHSEDGHWRAAFVDDDGMEIAVYSSKPEPWCPAQWAKSMDCCPEVDGCLPVMP